MTKNDSLNRLEIFKSSVLIRMVEQYIVARYPEQKMRCPTHLCLGQEAVPAVFGYFSQVKDAFVGTYRSHGHFLAKGGDVTSMFAELLGSQKGCSGGLGGSMHLVDSAHNFIGTTAIVAAGVPIAAGVALSFKYRNEAQAAVAFTGDAALEEGIYYETVNYACLHKLPLIFVCENNGLAIATPIALRQASLNLAHRFESLGIKSFNVKENDMDRLINVAREAFEYTRGGHGPVFIEYEVTRWSVHVGHDVQGPLEGWWQDPMHATHDHCPLSVLVRPLLNNKTITLEYIQNLRSEISTRIDQAYKKAQDEYVVSDQALEDYVYASGLTSILPQARLSQKIEFSTVEPSRLVNPF